MSIVITGGTGFLGTHLCRLYEKAGQTVHGLGSGANLLDPFSTREMYQKYNPSVVIHLAAVVGGIGANQVSPADFFYKNLLMGMNVIHQGMIFKVPKIVIAGTICFPEGTPIEANGIWKDISTASIGELVLTHNNKLCSITNIIKSRFDGLLSGIKVSGLPTIFATPEHPFYVAGQFVESQHIKIGDKLSIPIKQYKIQNTIELLNGYHLLRWSAYKSKTNHVAISTIVRNTGISKNTIYAWSKQPPKAARIVKPIITSKDIAWLIGAYVAEGFCDYSESTGRGSRNYVYWTPGFDLKFCDDISLCYDAIFGKPLRYNHCETSIRLEIGDEFATPIFSKCYVDNIRTAEYKSVPDFIMKSDNETVKKFIRGYWRGDGHFKRRKYRTGQYLSACTSVSRHLILQIKSLLLRLGIHSVFCVKNNPKTMMIDGRVVKPKTAYSLRITGKWAIIFGRTILKKRLRDAKWVNRSNDPVITTDVAFYPVKQLSSKEHHGDVYNLSVNIDESYCPWGVATHNCAYPKHTPVPFVEEDLWNGYPEETNAPYGIAKKSLLVMAQAYRAQYNLNVTYLLPVNLYGPGDNFNENTSHVIPALIKKIVDAKRSGAKSVKLWGTGSASREFLYVEDAAEAFILATKKYDKPEPLNIGTGSEIKILALAEKIAKLVQWDGLFELQTDKPDGQPRRCLDTFKAHKELGFTARTSLDEGLRTTIDWYLNQPVIV